MIARCSRNGPCPPLGDDIRNSGEEFPLQNCNVGIRMIWISYAGFSSLSRILSRRIAVFKLPNGARSLSEVLRLGKNWATFFEEDFGESVFENRLTPPAELDNPAIGLGDQRRQSTCCLICWRRSLHGPHITFQIRSKRLLCVDGFVPVDGKPHGFGNSHRREIIRHTAGFQKNLRDPSNSHLLPHSGYVQTMAPED